MGLLDRRNRRMGKLTINSINHGHPAYLFPGEFVSMERVA